jgi:rhamnogalacturonyl hydrolase YesR
MMTVCSTLVDAVARTTRTYPYRLWGFGESIAMEALLASGGSAERFAAELLTRWAHSAGSLGADPLAHVAPGVPLLDVYARCADPRLLERAIELAQVLQATQRGAHGARLHRPDLAGWQHTVWVDCMHLDAPFLVRLAQVSGDARWSRLAVDLLLAHARVLQDARTGLFSHGFDDGPGRPNGLFWGRGQGWALLGLVDTATRVPEQTEIRDRVRAQVGGLAATELELHGRWHTVVDCAETYLEPSVSAFVALGVGRALRAGLVGSEYRALAARALAATRSGLDARGALSGVSDATPVGRDATHYGGRPRGVFPWGQGPALLALLEDAQHD